MTEKARKMRTVQIPDAECISPVKLAKVLGMQGPQVYSMIERHPGLAACTFTDPLTGRVLVIKDEALGWFQARAEEKAKVQEARTPAGAAAS